MNDSPIQMPNRTARKAAAEYNASTANGEIINSQRVFGNILSLGTSEIVARGIAFIGTSFLARKLGVEGFGMVGFAAAIFLYLSLPINFGFNDVGARELARRPQQAAEIAFNIILVKIALALVIFGALASAVGFFGSGQPTEMVVLLMSLTLFSLAIDTSWAYRGLERNHRVGASLILGQAIYVTILLFTVGDAEDVFYVPVAQLAGEVIAALFLLVPLYRLGGVELNFRKGWNLLRDSVFLTVSRLFRLLIYTFDVVMIGIILTERDVGLYAAPYRICFLLVAIAVTIHTSYLPALTRGAALSAEEVGRIAQRSINLAGTIAAPLVVGGMILAAPLLETIFGAEYAEGADAFRWLLFSIGLVFLHGANHNILLTLNRTKTEMVIYALAALLNVVLNIAFIPRYGLFGAALTTVFAEVMTLLAGLFILSREGIKLKLFKGLLRPIAASLLMGTVLFAFGSRQMLVLYLAAGAISYIVFLTILRGIPQDIQPFLQRAGNLSGELRRRFLKV